ncbi:MAG: CDP-glycerol glycerophosphotransferase family protein [Candidatus Neomarinimicrobiota bacterium]|nr:MAG: CDP-glycerol glycerophosphotransferase family protein [Candidatus Neomarinimicrobiota bacterium]
MKSRYLLFVTQTYSFSILEPVADVLRTDPESEFRWTVAGRARQEGPPDPGLELSAVMDWNPDFILVPGNVVPYWWPGRKIQVFHGLGEEKKGHYRITGFFDLYCTPGPHVTRTFLELRKHHPYFLVAETGWPKLDRLHLTDLRPRRKRELGLDPDQPVILYAPTFSPKLTSAPDLFPEIQRLQEKEYQWIIKFHPLMNADWIRTYQTLASSRCVFPSTDDILPLMEAADILVTDTSSVAYEFLLLDRPIVTFRARARQEKGIDISLPEDLEGAITRSLLDPEELASVRREIREELHPYLDGASSRRLLDTIRRLQHSGAFTALPKKPANWWRKWQLRRWFRDARPV